MRILIISDIHANLHALRAVSKHAEGKYDRVACLGDIVGYGADPNGACEWVREYCATTIRGNHDRACIGDAVVQDFNDNAQLACAWTLQELTEENRQWLQNLPAGPLNVLDGGKEDFFICHGSPRDEDEYITDKMTACSLFSSMPGNVVFFGHTHWQGGYRIAPGRAWEMLPPKPTDADRLHLFDPDKGYLMNPGSVGQPRDNDPRAAYALFDSEDRMVRLCRAEYDIQGAQKAIIDAGLPSFLAFRLGEGI
ncbi:MAG: metallophosphoesterase family protein [Acidobacteria bacterium]|nr:metallophosphoesterase family protein [Acidobacteriota bacterium]